MAVTGTDDPSEMEKKIIRQVEYYFGDMNLPRDKFLQEKMKEDDGWVTLDVMLNFNRLKSITEDKEQIYKALQKSKSGLMEISEDLSKIRRSLDKPLPENTKERKQDINARSVYVKGLPTDSTLDSLMQFFEEHGKIDTILMHRTKTDKSFKGSVFVTFNSADDEKKFLDAEGLKYQETELIKMTKEEYFKKKSEEDKEGRQKNAASEKQKAEERKQEQEKKMEEQMTKGAVLFVKGLPKETTLEDLKAFFGEFGKVAWVEFVSGDDKASVRFNEAEAEEAMNKAKAAGDGKVVVNGAELETRVLDGDEEKEYWRKMFRDIADKNQKSKNKSFQNRKRKFGGRPNKRDNRNGDGESAAKAQKTE